MQGCRLDIHSRSFSASLIAVATGRRILSATPQSHQVPDWAGSDSGRAKWMAESPEAFRLPSGEDASASRVNPTLRQISISASFYGFEFSSPIAPKVYP